MALAKPEVKPTSPAAFGDIEIPFQYKVNLEEKSEVAFTIKVFDINNKLLFTTAKCEYKKISDIDYVVTTDLGGPPEGYIHGSFYKAALQISYEGEDSPWSNLTIFKYTTQPIITRLPWNKEREVATFFFNDQLIYILTDKTELLESIKYQYIIHRDDDGVVWNAPIEEIIIRDVYNENYEYNLKLKSVVDYDFVREHDNTNLYIGLKVTFYTKNGSFTKYWISTNNMAEMSVKPDNGMLIVEGANNQYGNVVLSVDTNGALLYRIYNNNWLILESKNNFDEYVDYFTDYNNIYSLFALKDNNFGEYYLEVQKEFKINCIFDSVFLIDAKEHIQLNVTLNNSVNSFKHNILETKTDTIGSQYPVFFRNPNTKYREFPLSGTISYHSLVSFGEEYGIDFTLPEIPHTNLTTDNLYAERVFREKVVEFLTKDRLLLYKSPTEGNIVVKLMNIQLTPNKTLGRMIYDFSCTCYEAQGLQSYIKECWE